MMFPNDHSNSKFQMLQFIKVEFIKSQDMFCQVMHGRATYWQFVCTESFKFQIEISDAPGEHGCTINGVEDNFWQVCVCSAQVGSLSSLFLFLFLYLSLQVLLFLPFCPLSTYSDTKNVSRNFRTWSMLELLNYYENGRMG